MMNQHRHRFHNSMLILTRRMNHIDALRDIPVHRMEIYKRIQQEQHCIVPQMFSRKRAPPS